MNAVNVTAKPQARFFAYTAWDAIPTLMGLGHMVFLAWLFFGFRHTPWTLWIPCALLYAISIAWSINSTSHNFIHNRFFVSPALNRIYSFILSLTDGFSQEFYHHVHLRHHVGNMDRVGANGTTIDPLSIYRHGRDGKPESPWTYTFYSYFRDDIGECYTRLKTKHPELARWIRIEIATVVAVYLACLIYDWRAFLCLVPFYYLGHSLSSLNGYYEHYKGNPDQPIAWGVSTYNKLYNWTWLYNGYHAEHHYRPKTHWTQMRALRDSIFAEQRANGVHVMPYCHGLGFLDRQPPAYTLLRSSPSLTP
ncbi:MAG: fatty acid desaturase [Rhodanobacteraceae bacterium]